MPPPAHALALPPCRSLGCRLSGLARAAMARFTKCQVLTTSGLRTDFDEFGLGQRFDGSWRRRTHSDPLICIEWIGINATAKSRVPTSSCRARVEWPASRGDAKVTYLH